MVWVIFTARVAHFLWMETHLKTSESLDFSQGLSPANYAEHREQTERRMSPFRPRLRSTVGSHTRRSAVSSGNLRWWKTNTRRLNQTKGESYHPSLDIFKHQNNAINKRGPRVHIAGRWCNEYPQKCHDISCSGSLFLLPLPLWKK